MAAPRRYTTVAIVLHWAIAILIVGQLFGGFYVHDLPKRSPEYFELIQLHKSVGITILILSLLRLGWRLTHRPPPLPAAMPAWQKTISHATHWLFYAAMIGVPLGGWLVVSSSPFAPSVPTYLWGVVPWPHLPFFDVVADRKALSETFAELHELGAKAIIALLGLHLAAVAKHAFLDRDGLLTRMIPARN
jgi:cytochrome b561